MVTPSAMKQINTAVPTSAQTSDLTRELDAISRKYGIAIVGGRIQPIDMSWDAPDAEQWAQYGLTSDGSLVRGFWEI